MADWFTHALVGWIVGNTTKQDVALIVVGTLIPDLVKVNLAFLWLGVNDNQFFDPLHTPIGALIVAGIIALGFQDIKKTFLALTIGISTHFILDFFLVHVHGGIPLLFPFSWDQWQVYLIRSDDYRMTIVALLAAVIVYLAYRYQKRKNKTTKTETQ